MKTKILIKPYIERGRSFVPTRASKEAQICLSCPFPDCNVTNCARFRKEIKNIKRSNHGKVNT